MTDPQTVNLMTWIDHWRKIAEQHEAEKIHYRIAIGRALAQLNVDRPGKARQMLMAAMLDKVEPSDSNHDPNSEMLEALNEVQQRIDVGDFAAAQQRFTESVRRFTERIGSTA